MKEREVRELLSDIKRYNLAEVVVIEGKKYLRLNFDPRGIEVKGLPELKKETLDVSSALAEEISKKTRRKLKDVMSEINKMAMDYKIYNQVAAILCAKKYGIKVSKEVLRSVWDSLLLSGESKRSEGRT